MYWALGLLWIVGHTQAAIDSKAVLVGSDASADISFSYPKISIGQGALIVGTHASIGAHQSTIVRFDASGAGSMSKIAASNQTFPAHESNRPFDLIETFDLTPSGHQ